MVKVSGKTDTQLAERFVVAVLVPMALWNFMAHIALIAGFITFRTLSVAYSGVLFALVV